MGQSSSSSSVLPSADPQVPYFSLTFQTPDKLTLALADASIIALTRSAIVESQTSTHSVSRGGVTEADDFLHYEGSTDMNSHMFKFRGLPFMRGCGRVNSFRANRMCCRILEKYAEHGWRLVLASDLSRAKELTTWFFCRTPGGDQHEKDDKSASQSANGVLQREKEETPHRRNVVCVSTSGRDVLRLANAPEAARRLLTQSARATYGANGVKSESAYEEGDFEIQLTESPWLTDDVIGSIRTRRLLLEIIRRFEMVGYQFYGTANTKGTSDSLLFISTRKTEIGLKSSSPTSPASPKTSLAHLTDDVRYSYCAISLNFSNCLRVIEAPPHVVKAVLRAILRCWPLKLQHQKTLDDRGTHEFKLRGNPWWQTGGEEAIAARVFLCGLLETLKSIGWEPLTALDVSRSLNNKAVFIFRSPSTPTVPDESFECSKLHQQHNKQQLAFLLDDSSAPDPYWCLSMHEQSTIRLIGAPEEFRRSLRHTIDQLWPWGVQSEVSISGPRGGYEFKLRGGPWGAEQQSTTALMCYILKTLNDHSCRVELSADVTGRYVLNNHGGAHSLDVHSWFLTLASVPQDKNAAGPSAESSKSASSFDRLAHKRRSMPFLARAATDDFLFIVEHKEPVVSGSPPADKEEPRSLMGFSIRKFKKRPVRKISAITECQ